MVVSVGEGAAECACCLLGDHGDGGEPSGGDGGFGYGVCDEAEGEGA